MRDRISRVCCDSCGAEIEGAGELGENVEHIEISISDRVTVRLGAGTEEELVDWGPSQLHARDFCSWACLYTHLPSIARHATATYAVPLHRRGGVNFGPQDSGEMSE